MVPDRVSELAPVFLKLPDSPAATPSEPEKIVAEVLFTVRLAVPMSTLPAPARFLTVSAPVAPEMSRTELALTVTPLLAAIEALVRARVLEPVIRVAPE